MKAIIFTNNDGPENREYIDIGAELETEGKEVEYVSWEEERATRLSELYDLYNPPALIVIRDDGSLIECWQGDVPLVVDVKARLANG